LYGYAGPPLIITELDWEEEEEDDKERGPTEDAPEEAAAVADALMLSRGNWPVFQRSASIWLLLMANLPRPGSKTSLQIWGIFNEFGRNKWPFTSLGQC
jgi:hypothetical protein